MISFYKKIDPKNPVLIAAWPGMGHVAINAAKYLKDKLNAELFAKFKAEAFFYPKDIEIHDGVVDISNIPEGEFYYYKNKTGFNDLIIFISEQQPPMEEGMSYAQIILDFAVSLNAKMVFTFAALLTSMDYTQMPKVYLAVTQKDMIAKFNKVNTKSMRSGYVSGLNGLFLGAAKKMKLKGACFLGEIPFYMSQIENPRASMVLLKKISKILDIQIDLNDLILADKMMIEEIGKLMENMREPDSEEEARKPISIEDIDMIKRILDTNSRIPNSAKEQIEDLFLQAKKDISYAHRLKKKLDEWHAYKEYEDRFLNLFKNKSRNNN